MPVSALPNAGAYNVWGPKRAEYLYSNTGSGAANILNALAGRFEAGGERRAYEAQLAQAQQHEAAQMEADRRAQLAGTYLSTTAGHALAGIGGAVQPVANPYITTNPQIQHQASTVHLDAVGSEANVNNTNSIVPMLEAGIPLTEEFIEERMAGALDSQPARIDSRNGPYLTPKSAADQTNAAANMRSANAQYLSAEQEPEVAAMRAAAAAQERTTVKSNTILPGAAQVETRSPDPQRAAAGNQTASGAVGGVNRPPVAPDGTKGPIGAVGLPVLSGGRWIWTMPNGTKIPTRAAAAAQ